VVSSPWPRLVASGAALLGAILLWNGVQFLPRPLQRWTSGESYPSGAAAYLAAVPDPPKRLFNYYSWGGYLMLRAPGIPVFIDSRASTLYDDDLAADYFGMLDAAGNWREKFAKYGVDAILVPPHSRIAAALQNERPAWRTAYIDPRSVLLFPPAGPARTKLASPSRLLTEGADLQLSRGFRWRRRGNLEKANTALLAAQRMDPMQLFVYGELMFVASLQEDADEVRHRIEEALRVYPRRWNPIWSFAEQAWGAMGRCEEALEALRKIRLGSPFVADELRDEVQTRIRESECSPVRYTPEDRGSTP
jgi:tetratricopeptide (TPR) repeat protein